jgi:protein-S-isoprenylcysteine O-methyltransferase Ste14
MPLFMTSFTILSVLCTVWYLTVKRSTLLTYKRPRDLVTARPVLAVVYSVLLHWREDLRAWVIRVGQLLFRFRDYLFPLALVITAAVTKPVFPLGSERVDRWLDGMGLMVALLGQGCRLLAVGSVLNIRRGGRNKQFTADDLIQDGFFAHTRNPLYLGNLLIAAGLVLIADSPAWFLVVLPLTVSMYCAIVLAEEAFLTARFDRTYIDYCRRVRRFLPTFVGLRYSLLVRKVDWRRALGKEAHIFCSWGSFVVGLLIWKQLEMFGFAARRAEIVTLALAWVITIGIVFGVGWWLKNPAQS